MLKFKNIKLLIICYLALGVAYAGSLDISTVPLELTPAVPPNILIVTDDSGSMDWEVLTQDNNNSGAFNASHLDGTIDLVNPITHRIVNVGGSLVSCEDLVDPATSRTGEHIDGYIYIVAFPSNEFQPSDADRINCFVADDDAWRARSHQFNQLYFNPDPTFEYPPWAGTDINGNPYGQADITNAPDDPYDPQSFIDLTDDSSIGVSNGVGFKYFIWNDANDDGIAQSTEEPTAVLIKDAPDQATKDRFANWFTYYRKREYVAKAIISNAVANNATAFIDHTTISRNPDSSFRVDRSAAFSPFSNQASVLNTIGLTNSTNSTTPLRTAYEAAGDYFACLSSNIFNLAASNPGDAECPITAAPAGSCQINSAFLLTDGFADDLSNDNPNIGNEDLAGSSDTLFDGGAFADSESNTLADVAMRYYEIDLHDPLLDDVPVLPADKNRHPGGPTTLSADSRLDQHLVTNVIGIYNANNTDFLNSFPSDATIPSSDPAGEPWLDPFNSYFGKLDDLRHAAYNGRGEFFPAIGVKDFPATQADVNDTFSVAATTPGSTSALAFNTQTITSDTLAFRTFSNLATNSGDLVAQQVEPDGTLKVDMTGLPIFEWRAADELDNSTRTILTFNDSATPPVGALFTASGLTAVQKDELADLTDLPVSVTSPSERTTLVDNRIDYLSGGDSNEGPNFDNGDMRIRAPVTTGADGINTGGKIGDIVHSSPVFVGQPPFANRFGGAFPSGSGNTYFEYRTARSNRDELVYVGANDGMLHAFNVADTADGDKGEERFAYVPNVLLGELAEYTKPDYNHQFYVDSTPSVNDAYIRPRGGSTPEWRTVLVNGLGAGGKGYFALDITDPNAIDVNSVMWEFTSNDDDALGFTYSRPIIAMSNSVAPAPTSEQRWVAIFGNGFNNESATGNAAIFIVFLDAGIDGWSASDYVKIDTNNGTFSANNIPNGIGGVTGIDTDGNGTVDRLYAGDLQGNVYAVDISDSSTINWAVEKTLFQASYTSDANAPIQAITTRPTVVRNPTLVDTYTVIVGTGSYFTTTDATSTDIQSIYGLWDIPGNTDPIIHTPSTSELIEQTLSTLNTDITTDDGDTFNLDVRTVTSNDVLYELDPTGTNIRGWHIDFDVPPASGTGIEFPGERPVRNLQLRNNQLFFNTVIPQDGTSCDPSAGGFGLSVNPLSGGEANDVIFDINIDGTFDEDDKILVSSVRRVISGTRFSSAPSDSVFIGDNRVTQLSDTNVDRILVNPDLNSGGGLGSLLGRHSWKEIRQ